MEMNISLGFVVFNQEEALLERLELASQAGFSLYIFDNSPEKSSVRDFCAAREDCYYFTCGKNVGLGYGISMICAQAYYDNYSTLLFFDQDTVFSNETLNFIEQYFRINRRVLGEYSSIIFNSKGSIVQFRNVLLGISSGSLFILENLKSINWHNVSYFVDCVDYEFCLNSNNHGFRIAEYTATPGFDHQTGQPDIEYIVLGYCLRLRKYSITRIMDALHGYLRLWWASLRSGNLRFLVVITRSWVIYMSAQILARVFRSTHPAKGR